MRDRGLLMRRFMAGIAVAMLVSACGGESLSLTDYVDRLNRINDRTVPQAEELISDLELVATPEEAGAIVEAMMALRIESVEATDELSPPESIAELHELTLNWEKQLVPIEEAFAARAATVSGWEEFFESAEVEAYRDALAEGKQVCSEFQARLDATADRGVFEDTPWIPTALTEVVEARLGCDLFPEDPSSVFRPAPPTTVPSASG